jgi:hypothetical protein
MLLGSGLTVNLRTQSKLIPQEHIEESLQVVYTGASSEH